MPRSKRRIRKQSKSQKSFLPLFLVGFLFLVIGFVVCVLKSGLWKGKEKFSVVVKEKNDVLVAVVDPEAGTVTQVKIPAETQVLVAGGLGSWKLGSVWQLGINEKKPGELLARTIAKNFGFPVFAWAEEKAQGFFTGQGLASAFFGHYPTNLRLGDRLALAKFALGVGQTKRTEINLALFNQFLVKKVLTDGSLGYKLSGKVPEDVKAVFTDEKVSDANLKAHIILRTSNRSFAGQVAGVIETIGAKVSLISDEEIDQNLSCLLRSKDPSLQKKLVRIFGCEELSKEKETGFDIEIILGEGFGKNF